MGEPENSREDGPAGGTPQTSEKPLFLAPKARSGDGHGYVNRPHMGMRDEPECVGPAILDGYAESASFHRTLQHQAAVQAARISRRCLPADDRVRDIQQRAKRAHVDMHAEVRLMRRMIDQAKRGGRNTPPSVITRLERAEAQLDGVPLAA